MLSALLRDFCWLTGPAVLALAALLLGGCGGAASEQGGPSSLPGLSGLAWVGDDRFVAVHDAKGEGDQIVRNRVSLLRLPRSNREGIVRTPLAVRFPGGVARDLEAASPIPGGGLLLAESGQKGGSPRMFFARLVDSVLVIDAEVPWPLGVDNVEAVEVGRVGDQLVLLAAERGRGRSGPPCTGPCSVWIRPVSALSRPSTGGRSIRSARVPEPSRP